MDKPTLLRDFMFVEVLCYQIFHDACSMEGTKLSGDVKANCKNTGAVQAILSTLLKFKALNSYKFDTDDDGYTLMQYAFINFGSVVYSITRELTDKAGVYEYIFKKNNEIVNRFTPQALKTATETVVTQPATGANGTNTNPVNAKQEYDNFVASVDALMPNGI